MKPQDPLKRKISRAQIRVFNALILERSKTIEIPRPVPFHYKPSLHGLSFLTLVTERNSYGLGYHNRQLDSINQSFPICNRNEISNTKGSDLVPYSGRLK